MNQMAQMNLLSEMAHNEWYYYGKKKKICLSFLWSKTLSTTHKKAKISQICDFFDHLKKKGGGIQNP